ncbi:hypothetical protein SLEP1_g30974 [Rubroshorea leprosula]|uniref:RING-type domain-containing protein n=1 Tax=Rubroshorea leprosula TaxID=152421 RepID=A0AAV5K1Z3_9ROSI|nr:hypothetical protein SLEP1_g30974 [Rubroshorea leprosula]
MNQKISKIPKGPNDVREGSTPSLKTRKFRLIKMSKEPVIKIKIVKKIVNRMRSKETPQQFGKETLPKDMIESFRSLVTSGTSIRLHNTPVEKSVISKLSAMLQQPYKILNSSNGIHIPNPGPRTLAVKRQNERLRLLLQEQRKQQVGIMMKKIESKASALLRQKDEEIARAVNKTMELENLLKKLEMENQAWQRVAQENKAMVLSLNSTLEQLRENASHCCKNVAEDAESCYEDNREEVKTEEEGQGRRNTTPTTTMVCKCCNTRSSCVLLLPCRHLCSCKDCEALLDSCPVCKTGKKASIEALIFRGEELSGKIEGNSQNRKRKSDDLDYGAWDELQQNLCVW